MAKRIRKMAIKKNQEEHDDNELFDDDDVSFKVSVNTKERTIDIRGEICSKMIFDVKEALEKFASDSRAAVRVFMNSPGGEVHAGLAIHDLLKNAPFSVTTICVGECYSAGLIMFLGGTKRMMYPNSYIAFHESTYSGGSLAGFQEKNADIMANSIKKLNKIMKGIIKDNSSLTEEEIPPLFYGETIFTAEEALTNGLATEIIGRKKQS
jgi:ATP-dependent Clp protease protease subunit